MSENQTLIAAERLTQCLPQFPDVQLHTYIRFASEIRDQNINEGSIEEVTFWNSLIQLFVEERDRRHQETQWLDTLYRLKSEPRISELNSHSSPDTPL